MIIRVYHCLTALFLVGLSRQAPAQEWTRFRGPNGSGVSYTKTIPSRWTDRDINWKVTLPGTGHSSPVLWGERIFLTATEDVPEKIRVLCLKAEDGSVHWNKEFPYRPFEKHKFNSFSSATPAVDESRVYVAWSVPERYTLMALDHQGNTVWERDLGPFQSQHGCGTSPIVYRDLVILGNDQDGSSCLLAVEAKTGQTRWKTPRRTAVTSYATPCLFEPNGEKPALIFNSQAHGISALDPDSGSVLWEYGKAFDKRTVSSPIVAAGLILGSCGSGGGGNVVTAVRPGSPVRNPELAYTIRRSAPYVPTSVVEGDRLFLWSDAGVVSCVQVATGELRWQERVAGEFFSSPVWVAGRLFGVSTTGQVVVVDTEGKPGELGRYSLDELSRSTPAVAGGRMYVRTVRHLMSVGGRPTAP